VKNLAKITMIQEDTVLAVLMLRLKMGAGMSTIRNMMKNANTITHSEKILENVFQMRKESMDGLFIQEIIKRMKNSTLKITSL